LEFTEEITEHDERLAVSSKTKHWIALDRKRMCFHLNHKFYGFGMHRAELPDERWGRITWCVKCFEKQLNLKLETEYENRAEALADHIEFLHCPHRIETDNPPRCNRCYRGITKLLRNLSRRSPAIRKLYGRVKLRFENPEQLEAEDTSRFIEFLEKSLSENGLELENEEAEPVGED
jgi:hypothetical protein